jgi:membrane-associated protein
VLALVEQIVRWVGPAFEAAGYVIVGVAVLLERSILIGLIVPGDIFLALGGVYSARGNLSLPWVIVIGILAATTGESVGYWLGRRYGKGLVRRLPFGDWLVERVEGAQDYFRRHGGKTVAIGRFATAAGAFIPLVAGIARMPYRRFLLFDIPAIVVWAVGIAVFGYYFGQHLDFVDKALSRFGYIVLGLLVAFLLGRYLWKRRTARREQRGSAKGS